MTKEQVINDVMKLHRRHLNKSKVCDNIQDDIEMLDNAMTKYAAEWDKEIERLKRMIEKELKRNMRVNMPGITELEQNETWKRYAELNNL